MGIYRGAGGSGDAVADASSEASLIKVLAVEVQADADAAQASATSADASATAAATSATNSANSATAAAGSASSASSSASSATSSASSASTSATNAASSATAAQTAETNAETAETNATASASLAQDWAIKTTGAVSGGEYSSKYHAQQSASSASAASTSASAAATSATNASNSASAAATSATNASNSASAAATSATNAASSATSASGSASTATTQATNASNSATAAASSATSAAGSATTATTQAGIATTQATNAASSASAASTSATNAASSATAAAGSATTASTQATNAANSASAAATSETNAAASAAAAAGYVVPSQTGNAGKYLKTDGTAVAWDGLDISTADITGTLPVANGGTGATTSSTARTNLGVTATGADTTYAYRANNLSDLASASTARANLGLGTAATSSTGDFLSSVNPNYTGTLTGGTGVVNLGSGQFYKDASGNVGIGVVPSAWGVIAPGLDIGSRGGLGSYTNQFDMLYNAYYDGGNFRYKATDQAVAYRQLQGGHVFDTAPSGTAGTVASFTERMRIDSSGNVGIGTSSPTTLLQLGGATNKSMRIDSATGNAGYIGTYQTYTAISANRNPSTGVFADTGKAAASITLDSNVTNGQIFFSTTATNNVDPTERMRIDSSGNLLVGTTTTNGDGISFRPRGSAGSTSQLNFNRASTTTTGYPIVFQNGGSDVGYIQMTNTTVSYVNLSDYRLKDNIVPMTGALNKVSALKPVTYKWKADGSDGQGFIAHELQAVAPECVTGEKDAVDAEGKPVYQGIDTSFLVATLTAAIQELKAQVDAQALEIQALKGTV